MVDRDGGLLGGLRRDLGDMFTYALTLLEIKLNKLIELTGHDIELTDKT